MKLKYFIKLYIAGLITIFSFPIILIVMVFAAPLLVFSKDDEILFIILKIYDPLDRWIKKDETKT